MRPNSARPYGGAGVQSVFVAGIRAELYYAPHRQVHRPAPLIRRHPHLRLLEIACEGPQEHLCARPRREPPTVAPLPEGTPQTFAPTCMCVCVRYWRSTPCARQRRCPARCASPPRIAPPTRAAAAHTPPWVRRARAPTTRPPPAPPPSCARSPTPAAMHPSAPDGLSVDALLPLAVGSEPKATGASHREGALQLLEAPHSPRHHFRAQRLAIGERGERQGEPPAPSEAPTTGVSDAVICSSTLLTHGASSGGTIGTYRWSFFELGGCVLVGLGRAREGVEAE
jgi:hypothetical protein